LPLFSRGLAWRMLVADVIEVLDALDRDGVRHWVGGGWGVVALTGRQTREHRDLDLAVDRDDLDTGLATLQALGYVVETDWLPVRAELRASGARWVDVHPVSFDAGGHGRQPGLDGGSFEYPPDAFTRGAIAGRRVNCLSVVQQRRFRTGYEPRPQDFHDLAELDRLAGRPGPGPRGGRGDLH
jgi:lincosamide nucleotidyltransferase A/C/D/E